MRDGVSVDLFRQGKVDGSVPDALEEGREVLTRLRKRDGTLAPPADLKFAEILLRL